MSVCVAVTDNKEGHAAFAAAIEEAAHLGVPLLVVNLTAAQLDTSNDEVSIELVVPGGTADLDEVEQVLKVLDDRPEITRLVVGVRKRSPVGKALLGSIPQRLILEANVPVLSVSSNAV